MKQLIIIGAGGHGKVVADIAKKNGYEDIRFLDDNEKLSECGGYPVIGRSSDSSKYRCDMFVAIGNAEIRQKIQEQLGNIATLIHPDAVIADDVKIGAGSVVMAGTVINSGAIIGRGCVINTGSSVDHDCILGDYVHISVGAHLAGAVEVRERTWVGIGAIVSNNLTICSDCMIGAGAVIVKNIFVSGIYEGLPARLK